MANNPQEAEAKLRKLGQRLRESLAKQSPLSDRHREAIRGAVRDQWQHEQDEIARAKAKDKTAQPKRETPEPGGN